MKNNKFEIIRDIQLLFRRGLISENNAIKEIHEVTKYKLEECEWYLYKYVFN